MFKRILMVMTVGVLAVGCIALPGCGSSTKSENNSETQQAGTENKEEKESNYAVSIDEAVVETDYQDRPALVVTFTFTNNSDEAKSFMVAISDKAFQNGVQLESTVISGMDAQGPMKEIKPGATTTVQQVYLLDDETEVSVECSELISFDDTILAEATFAVV